MKAFGTKGLGRMFEIRRHHPPSVSSVVKTSGRHELCTITNLLLACSSLPAYGFRTHTRSLWPRWSFNDMILFIARTVRCTLPFKIIYAVLGSPFCGMLVIFACFDHDTSIIPKRLRESGLFYIGTCARSQRTA